MCVEQNEQNAGHARPHDRSHASFLGHQRHQSAHTVSRMLMAKYSHCVTFACYEAVTPEHSAEYKMIAATQSDNKLSWRDRLDKQPLNPNNKY